MGIQEPHTRPTHDLLAGRTVIVTGAATGIGQAFAVGAAPQGAKVVVADMNAADETVAAIEAAGGQALAVRVDVADDDSVQAMAAAALKRFGRIDGLVNSAAYFREVRLTPFERPLGGTKRSGHGREKGLLALEEVSTTKTLLHFHG